MDFRQTTNRAGRRDTRSDTNGRADLAGVRRRVGEQAAELALRAAERGQQLLEDGKAKAAAQLGAVGGAVRRAADKLHDQDSAAIAAYVDGAAERVEEAARYLDEREVEELVADAEAAARRRPVLFLGGMFLAGLAVAQVMKAAGSPAAEPRTRAGRSAAGSHAGRARDAADVGDDDDDGPAEA